MKHTRPYRLIITGGGTGGHLFPAIAIALYIKERYSDADILFIGAVGKIEMTQVPKAGFEIIGLQISGLNRKRLLPNLILPFKLILSLFKAWKILSVFKPDIIVSTGGYVSAPIAIVAGWKGMPILVQEQNSYAGLANKMIARKATTICVAYPHMDQYFPKKKIVFTGNPIYSDLLHLKEKKQMGLEHFSLNRSDQIILILGGSLGAKTINESVLLHLDKIIEARVQILWQTGKIYYDSIKEKIAHKNLETIRFHPFIQRMDLAYAVSDIVVSRSGALTISELCVAGKAAVLVPSPNVAENHQTKNAQALIRHHAAILIQDVNARATLIDEVLKLLHEKSELDALSSSIRKLGNPMLPVTSYVKLKKLLYAIRYLP